jgi:hypothetical protein
MATHKADALITSMSQEQLLEFEDWMHKNTDHPAYGKMIAAGTKLFNLLKSMEQKAEAFKAKEV